MGFWAFREKVVPGPPSASELTLSEQVRVALPPSYEAVGEALFAGRSATDACEVVGRLLGGQGVSLEETLADLRSTYELVLGTEPGVHRRVCGGARLERGDSRVPPSALVRGPADRACEHGPPAGPAH